MAYLQGKTPITYLQELCTKRGINPQYCHMAREGAVHDPTFFMQVTAGEFSGIGKGNSKKKAQHNAALSVLNQIEGGTSAPAVVVDHYDSSNSDAKNPVSELQEFAMKRLLKPPFYEYSDPTPVVGGAPNEKDFVCKVTMGNISMECHGKSKKEAKRAAAQTCVAIIRAGLPESSTAATDTDPVNDDPNPLPVSDASQLDAVDYGANLSLKKNACVQASVDPCVAITSSAKEKYVVNDNRNFPAAVDLQHEAFSAKHLAQIIAKYTKPGDKTDYVLVLEEIAREQCFNLSCIDVAGQSNTGPAQCVIEAAVQPTPLLCHGSGASDHEARNDAASNLIECMALMHKIKIKTAAHA